MGEKSPHIDGKMVLADVKDTHRILLVCKPEDTHQSIDIIDVRILSGVDDLEDYPSDSGVVNIGVLMTRWTRGRKRVRRATRIFH